MFYTFTGLKNCSCSFENFDLVSVIYTAKNLTNGGSPNRLTI